MSRCYISLFLVTSIVCYATSSTVNEFPDKENIARVLIEILDKEYAVEKGQEVFSTYLYNINVSGDNLNKMVGSENSLLAMLFLMVTCTSNIEFVQNRPLGSSLVISISWIGWKSVDE